MNLFSLNDQVILVTGSSRGLGWEMAKAMAEAGATVILNGRDQELLSKRQTELEKAGLNSDIQAFDAANENEVLNGVQSIAEKHGQLDGLINNAGIQHRKPLQDFELSDYDRLMDVNLRGSFLLAREASKLMLEKSSGSIVNIASIMGPLGRKTISAYPTSKGGIVGLTNALAVELGRDWIRVNSIGPTAVATEGTEEVFGDKLEQATKAIAEGQSLKRTLSPDDLTGTVLYLASDASKFVTGQTIMVDGGTVFL